MKTLRLLPFASLLAALVAGCQTSTPAPAPFDAKDGRVTITFHEPDKFSDARIDGFNSGTQPALDAIGQFLQTEVRRYLQSGERVRINFTDIDLTGEFEPWRRPGLSEVRIVKPIYPARLVFTYVRTGADGKVISQGDEKLTNLGFQMSSNFNAQNDRFFYEKELIRDWARQALKPKT